MFLSRAVQELRKQEWRNAKLSVGSLGLSTASLVGSYISVPYDPKFAWASMALSAASLYFSSQINKYTRLIEEEEKSRSMAIVPYRGDA